MNIKNIKTRNKFILYVLLVCLVFLYYIIEKGEKHVGRVPDITDDFYFSPPKGRSIFFIETSSNEWDNVYGINLTSRQACSIESAAKHNPRMTVYVLFTSPRFYPNLARCISSDCAVVQELLRYKNIRMRSVNMTSYFKGTPLEEWLKKGELWESYSLVEHTSDVMRFLTLWKFGGTYLDLDILVLKSLEDLGSNFAGAQSRDLINSAVINFAHSEFGHELAELCLREIKSNFNGSLWDHNGPGLVTRVMSKVCKTKNIPEMTLKRCNGFQVLPESAFYPIHFVTWEWLFTPVYESYVTKKVNGSFTVHLWNKLSSDKIIFRPKNSNSAYARLAEVECPNVFKHTDLIF